MTGLTQPPENSSRKNTMLAYRVNYYPWHFAASSGLVHWRKEIVASKGAILRFCNEDLTHMGIVSTGREPDPTDLFKIHWVYNNIPTQEEWDKITPHSTFILDYRVSPAADGNGRIVILQPDVVNYRTRRMV